MDINERIQQIGKYFSVFNVHEGVVFLGINLPEKWTLFDTETICEEFNIQINVKDGVTYFLCSINDGLTPVFDAVDFIIQQNEALEEKTSLLLEKVDELRSIFEKESLEKLKTLQFVFSEEKINQVTNINLPIDIKQQLKQKSTKKAVVKEEEEVKPESEPKQEPEEKVQPKKRKKFNKNV